MRITVDAKPGSKVARVAKLDERRYIIAVTARPEHGKANDAVRRALADALGVAPSRCSLVMGTASRTKKFEVQ